MKTEIRPKGLDKALHIDGYQPGGIPGYIVDKALRFILFAKNAPNVAVVLSYPNVDTKPKEGKLKGLYGVRLNKQWRLLFKIDKKNNPVIIRIEYIGKHYE